MHSLLSMRPYRLLTFLIPLTILMGCGDGDGPTRIENEPAAPFAGPPDSCFEALTFEEICDQPITFTEFEGAPGRTVDNPDQGGINPSAKVAEFVKLRAASGATFGGTVVDFSAFASLDIPAGSFVTVKVWSQRSVPVLLEPEGGGAGSGDEVTHGGTGWEELTFNLNFSGTTSGWVFIFDNGTNGDGGTDPENWTFYADDISLPMDGGGGGGGPATTLPVDFEADPATYDFGPDSGFGGGAASVIANPDASGINTSAQVGQMQKFPGEVFGGATLAIETTTVLLGSSFTMKVWSQRAVNVLLQPEPQGPGFGVEVAHGGTGWEELTFPLPFSPGDLLAVVSGLTIIFDNGTPGAADTDPTNWTFYFDDITLVPPGGGGTLGPVDFEPGGQGAGFTWNVFENGDNPPLAIISNPDQTGANTSATVAEFTARQAGQPFAGTVTADLPTFTLDASNAIVKILVWKSEISDVGIKFENATGGSTGEIKVANTVINQWEELTFDFSGVIGDPVNTDITGLVIFPDFNARAQDNVIYFDDIDLSDGSGGGTGGGATSIDFESGSATFNDFEGGVATVIANPDASGINTSAQVGQMQKFAGAAFGGSTLDLGGTVSLAAGDSYTMKVWSQREVPVTLKLETQGDETVATHSGSGTWEELCFDFTGVSGDIVGLTLIFDNGTAGDAGNPDPGIVADWTFYFDDIQQVSSCPTGGGGTSLGPIDFEPNGQGEAFAWTVFENGDNPPLEIIDNPDQTGANTSGRVAQFTARQAGQPFAGTVTADLPTFTLDASNAIVKIKVWKSVISDVGIKFENGAAGSTGEIKVANTVTNQWEELTFDFSGVIGDPNNTDITGLVIFPDFDARTQENVIYFDDVTFEAVPATGGGGLGPVDFEPGGQGAAFTWNVFENGDNPALAFIANPDATGANTSATVAQFTARQAGQPFAGTVTADLPTFTLDASNAIVKIKVWKSVISDVGIKFENGTGGSTGEIKVANTVTNQWEELTFDFSGVIGDPNNTDITGLVIFPDFDARTQENVIYFDDITFEAVPATGGGALGPVDFEPGGQGAALTWNVFENGDNPPLAIISNPDQTGANTSATVAQFTARQAGQPFAGTITSDLPTFTLAASNAIVKIKVWKSVISDVGIKFENGAAGSTGEIKVANTVTNQWEELTFDFSGVIGDPNNTDITGLIIFPDFDARTQENIVYFDDVSFSAVGSGG